MTKTKKKIAVIEPEMTPSENEPEPDLIIEPAPIVKEKHFVRREWERSVPLDEIDDASDDDDDDGDEPEEAAPVKIDDPIEAAVAEMAGSSSEWEIHVYRLPNYHNDQRADFKSRKFAGKLPVPDADYLRNDRYLEDLQLRFADHKSSNFFALAIRRDRAVFRWINGISVDPLSPQEAAQRVKENPAPFAPPSPFFFEQPSGGGDMDKFFKQLKQMQSIGLLPPLGAQPAAQPAAMVDPEIAALSLVAKNPDAMEAVYSRLFRGFTGGDGGDLGWWGFLRDFAVQPEVAKGFGMLLQGIASAITVQSQPTQTNGLPPAPPVAAPPQAVPAQQPPPAGESPAVNISEAEGQLWGFILQSMAAGSDIPATVAQIEEFLKIHPDLDKEGGIYDRFLNAEPQPFIVYLAQNPQTAPIASRPGLVEWIANFQRIASEEESETPVIEVKPEVVH